MMSQRVPGDRNTTGAVLILTSQTTVAFPHETWRGSNKAARLAACQKSNVFQEGCKQRAKNAVSPGISRFLYLFLNIINMCLLPPESRMKNEDLKMV